METLWDHRFAQRTEQMSSSSIRELLKLTQLPDLISFAGGLPAPDVFPIKEFSAASTRLLETNGSAALQYGPTEGYLPLRELICRHTSRYGIHINPDNVLITSGSQQALDLLGKIFINRGDRIITESPTYLGALQAWRAYGAEFLPVACDQDGLRLDALEEALRAGPKFIYLMPNFQNPTGVTLAESRRAELISMAEKYGVPLIEDDPYGQLRYEGEHLPSLVVLDSHKHASTTESYRGNVIYLSTFSKTLAPGLRLGWVIAPTAVIQKLVQAKQGADLHTATFNQMLAHEVSQGGFLDTHIRTIRKVYGERRDVMLAALEEHFHPGITWTRPAGGLFLWVTLAPTMRATDLLEIAVREKVAFVPGQAFYPDGNGHNTLRLNFSNASPEEIRTGIQRLAIAIQQLSPDLQMQNHH